MRDALRARRLEGSRAWAAAWGFKSCFKFANGGHSAELGLFRNHSPPQSKPLPVRASGSCDM